MKQTGQKSIRKIRILDRIQEISDLWDSIPDKDAALPVPAWHLAELKKRHAAIEKDPRKLISLDEFVRRYEFSI
jgi:putative addiction module component (TIGR02574 family)